MIILSDRKALSMLLDKKGSIYSNRPLNYVTQYVTHGDHLTLEVVGPSWREKRMVVTRNLNPKSLDEKHFKIQEAEYVEDPILNPRTQLIGTTCFTEPSSS